MVFSELASFIAFWNLTKRAEIEESSDISPEYAYAPSHYQEPVRADCVRNNWTYSHRYDHSGPCEGYDHYQPYPGYETNYIDSNYYSHKYESPYERDIQFYGELFPSLVSSMEQLVKQTELFAIESAKRSAEIDKIIAELMKPVEDRRLYNDSSSDFSHIDDTNNETAVDDKSVCFEDDDGLHTGSDFRNNDTDITSESSVSYPTHDHITDYLPIQKDDSCIRDTIYSDNDDLEEPGYTEDIIVETNDDTVDVHSGHLNSEIPISHLVADNNEAIIHDMVAPLSSCFADPSCDSLIADANVWAIDTGQVTCIAYFEPISVCLAHFTDSEDPMLFDIVNASRFPLINKGDSTTEVISSDLEPDLGYTIGVEISSQTLHVIHESNLLRVSLHGSTGWNCAPYYCRVILNLVSSLGTNRFCCRFIFAPRLIRWVYPQLFKLYICDWQFTLGYQPHIV